MTRGRHYVVQPVVWVKAGITAVILSIALSLGPITWRAAIENFTGADYWFRYDWVRPIKDSFPVGEDLTFVSRSEIFEPVRLRFHDVLFCDFGGAIGRHYYSNYLSESTVLNPRAKTSRPWRYLGAIPRRAAQCDLVSTITAELRYTSKSQVVRGPQFSIAEVVE